MMGLAAQNEFEANETFTLLANLNVFFQVAHRSKPCTVEINKMLNGQRKIDFLLPLGQEQKKKQYRLLKLYVNISLGLLKEKVINGI